MCDSRRPLEGADSEDISPQKRQYYEETARTLAVTIRATVTLDVDRGVGESYAAFRGRATDLAYEAVHMVDQAVVDLEDIETVTASENHSDDGQCHPECWARAVAEHEAAEAARRERQS